jgi:hypothetical protein
MHTHSCPQRLIDRYHLQVLPPDLWPLLLVKCAALALPQACTSTLAVLCTPHQRALVSADPSTTQLRVRCRGEHPGELRGRVHGLLVGLVAARFPEVLGLGAVHGVCPACGHPNVLSPHARAKVCPRGRGGGGWGECVGYLCVHVCLQIVCMCACVHVCMCACVHVCMCACVHVCMCACVLADSVHMCVRIVCMWCMCAYVPACESRVSWCVR